MLLALSVGAFVVLMLKLSLLHHCIGAVGFATDGHGGVGVKETAAGGGRVETKPPPEMAISHGLRAAHTIYTNFILQ